MRAYELTSSANIYLWCVCTTGHFGRQLRQLLSIFSLTQGSQIRVRKHVRCLQGGTDALSLQRWNGIQPGRHL